MKIEQANEISKKALEQLAQALERGQSEELKNYLSKMSQFHHYSFGNMLMILSQNPRASRVAGFRAWKKLNRFVRKGEKGIMIIAPVVRYAEPEEASTDRLKTSQEPQRASKVMGYKAAYVFDVSQTEGEDLPELSTVSGDPQHYLAQLKSFIAQLGIEVNYEEQGGGLFGFSSGGKITINPLMNTNPAVEFSTLAHEYDLHLPSAVFSGCFFLNHDQLDMLSRFQKKLKNRTLNGEEFIHHESMDATLPQRLSRFMYF